MNSEYIKYEANDKDAWVCICGNYPSGDGFMPCDTLGNEVEPTADWNGLYVCFQCGRIINQETLEVIGRNRSIKTLDGDTMIM